MLGTLKNAFSDISAGLQLRRVWVALASEDIGDQHRRTTLGPIWLILNFLIMIAIFVFLFQRGQGISHYPSYAATGLLIWGFISESITQGVTLFVREEGFIKGTRLPLSVYVMRLIMQSLIRMGYTTIACLLILYFDGIAFSWIWLWALPGLALSVAIAPAVIIVMAFLGAYFPDVQFVLNHLMRIGMFLTPIFWEKPTGQSLKAIFYHYNPFTHFIEIFRSPIIYGTVPVTSYVICVALGLALWALALPLLGYFRRRVVFIL